MGLENSPGEDGRKMKNCSRTKKKQERETDCDESGSFVRDLEEVYVNACVI